MIVIDIPNTIGCHESAALLPELKDAEATSNRIEAEERVQADVDSFANWLSSQCYQASPSHCRIGYVPRDTVRRAQFIESLDVPQLVALLLYPDAQLAGAAALAIRERYMRQCEDYIQRVATQVASEAA